MTASSSCRRDTSARASGSGASYPFYRARIYKLHLHFACTPRSLETYGARATTLAAPLGATVSPAELEAALLSARRKGDGRAYKLVTITHVDTSTGVRADARALAEVVRRVSPGTLVVLDAVCSLASEDLRMDDWSVDVVLSASQKGLGAPPGLSVLLAGERALAVWEGRKARGVKSGAFYSSWEK